VIETRVDTSYRHTTMQLSTMLLAMMVASEHRKRKRKRRRRIAKHSRYRKDFFLTLSDDSKRIRQRRLPRVSLLLPRLSAWRQLYHSKNDQGLITLTGFDFNSFNAVSDKFAPLFNSFSPFRRDESTITPKTNRRGKTRQIDAADCLGLVLAWTRTRGSMAVLQMIFGLTMTNLSTYLRFGRRIVIEVLKNDPDATIRLPADNEMQQYIDAIAGKHPSLGAHKVWCTVDGVKLMLQQAPNSMIQEQFYNGWTHDHYVTNVLCFLMGQFPLLHLICQDPFTTALLLSMEVFMQSWGQCLISMALNALQTRHLVQNNIHF